MVESLELSRFAAELATASGDVILPFFRSAFRVEDKSSDGTFDPVTEADHAAELVMRRRIEEVFPTHGIIGEEFGSVREDAEYAWVLDPVDGTRAFVAGLPLWGTLIGLMRGGVPTYGVVHQPFIGEMFAGDGHQASYRGPSGERTLRTRRCAAIGDAVLSSTSPRLFEGAPLAAFEAIESAVRLTRFGYDCYAYAMLAAGHIDLVIESGLKPYDVVALIPIIEGAGGIVTTWDGGTAAAGGSIVACGDPRLHEIVLPLLGG